MDFVWDSRAVTPQDRENTSNSSPQPRKRGAQVSLANCDDVFSFLEEFGVLVCKQHCTGVVNLDTHLRQQHGVPAAARKDVVEHFKRFHRVDPNQVQLPEQPAEPIAELGKPLDGLRCATCPYITVNTNNMRTHNKETHEKSWTGDKRLLYDTVKVQSFFRSGGLQNYFIVHLDGNENGESLDLNMVATQQLKEWTQLRSEIDEELQVMEDAAKTDKTGWYKRTGWLEFLKGRNLEHIGQQARLPDKSERRLQLAAELAEQLIEKSVKGLTTIPLEIRRWLRSAEQTNIDQRPLARLQNPESQATYASYIVRFVCFYLRIIADEEVRVERMVSQRERAVRSSEEEDNEEDEESVEAESGSDDSDYVAPQRTPRKQQERVDVMKDAREIFQWTKEQKSLAIQLWLVLDGGDRAAQTQALLDSLCSFLHTTYTNSPLTLGFVQYLAVLSIDTETGRLRTAKNYSYMLAGIVYCVRVLSAEKLLPQTRRDDLTDDDWDHFLEARKKYLADGSHSPMSETLSLLAYGKHIAQNQGNSGNAYWSEDKKIFYLNGRPIIVERFCRMAQGLVADVESALWPLCWVDNTRDRMTVDLKGLIDDVTFANRGMSFVTNSANHLSHGLQWMLSRARDCEEGMQLQTMDGQWKHRRVRQYLVRVDRFLELLLACVHITSGQPGRGSEITTIRFRNGLLQDRNVFVIDGAVTTVVRYHKSQSQWDKPKIVPRFLPERLAQVMAIYLVYVQPFREYLTVKVLNGSLSDYVWGNEHGAWNTDRLTRVLKRETKKRLGVGLHTLDYRHAAVGIGRVKVGEVFGKGYEDELGELEEAEVEEDGEDLIELQNARSTAMGVGNYSVPINIVKHLSARSIDAFRKLSISWHRFLGVCISEGERASEGNATPARRKRPLQNSISELVVLPRPKEARVERSREEDIMGALRKILQKDNVGFRSKEQEQAMNSVLDGQSPLVVVLPTGGGKSMLFTVPALVEETGVTIVVVPFRALIENLVERIRETGISCVEWTHGDTDPSSVVVVSADKAGDIRSNGNFLGYAGLLQTKGLLRRVVVDECHLVFTASNWRKKLGILKHLRLLGCPMVLLTATLPPVREYELESGMLIHNATYIRASTVRPNTRYFVSWVQKGKDQLEKTALTLCKRRHGQLRKAKQRGVVYCKEKKQCERVAEAVGCLYYHASLSLSIRAERVQEWLQDGGLIVATSALGTGVDYPGIVYILHVGMPWSMIDFAQESGRGGRAGERVDSVVLVQHGEVEETMEEKADSIDVQAMGVFLIGSGCRRMLMSRYLDGQGISCSEIESAGCDRCGEGVREWLDEQEEEGREWEQVQQYLDELRQGCVVCWVFGRCVLGMDEERWKGHRTMTCNRDEEVNVRVVDEFRQSISNDKSSHSCRRCWVSQKYCATGESMANACQWPNIVVPLAYTALTTTVGQEVAAELGFRGNSEKEYAYWLGQRHRERVWSEFFSNAMVLAIRVILRIG